MKASEAGIMVCKVCHKLARVEEGPQYCKLCHSPLHIRYPQSVLRTWALLITAMILYVPANLLPIMTVSYLGSSTASTIMEGVISFIQMGDWLVGIVVFIASILVPTMKLLGLSVLLIYVHRGQRFSPKACTITFRFIEWIGRWSMLDIFVIAIMVALVHFGNLSTIEANWGALAFASVVIITMFAAISFDPRLIWDRMDDQQLNEDASDE